MRKPFQLLLFLCFFSGAALAQDEQNEPADTTILHEFLVSAYSYDRPANEVPVAINVLQDKDLYRFNNTSLVAGLNTLPGVRMEERSPGSYRLSIRGSSIRSPFGIRNVKLYWNDLPFTDAGGNTYLNLFDFSSFQQIEIAKGPASSLYGAGTGGAVLLKNRAVSSGSQADFSTVAGSYGLLRYTVSARLNSEHHNLQASYAHQQSDGYREQTKMGRDVLQLNGDFDVGLQGELSTSLLYTDLFYQTPGGLTLQQFNENPRQARPPGGPNPGAVEQKATVYNKTFYSGLNYKHEWHRWSNKTGLYGTFTHFDNPTIRNYERRAELGIGGRTNFQFAFNNGRVNFGGEFQHGYSPIKVYDNNQGTSGALQTDDEVNLNTYFVFTQAEYFLSESWFLTVGASVNKYRVDFDRLSDTPPVEERRDFDPVLSPRIALLKKIKPTLSTYVSYSSGYSPPTVQELYPSSGIFDQQLLPESGNNLEAGIKGTALSEAISFNVVAYDFQLDETIVVRHDDDGAEYFVNAGRTAQRGAEVQVAWQTKINSDERSILKVWSSYTLNHYRFKDYQKDTISYDGNKLTGVPSDVLVAGVDLSLSFGLYFNSTFTSTEEIPLNDANTVFSEAYQLLSARLGFRKDFGRIKLDLFAGVDNVLDESYSLGHDLNAVGGRYYNAAPGRNYFTGFSGSWILNR